MKKTGELYYLKRITIVFVILYILFILMNFLEAIWHGFFRLGNGELDFLLRIKNVEGKVHFWINVLEYVLHFVFLLVANRFVKKNDIGKGYRFVIILLGFLPIANYFLLYMIWRRLNKQLFIHLGTDSVKSDRKIKIIWIMTLISILYLILSPVLFYLSSSAQQISRVSYYLSFGTLAGKIYYLVISLFYLLYFLELKRALDKEEIGEYSMNDSLLLDN